MAALGSRNYVLVVDHLGETDILQLSYDTEWGDIAVMLQVKYGCSEPPRYFYIDEEDDQITLDCEEAYKEALKICKLNSDVLHVRMLSSGNSINQSGASNDNQSAASNDSQSAASNDSQSAASNDSQSEIGNDSQSQSIIQQIINNSQSDSGISNQSGASQSTGDSVQAKVGSTLHWASSVVRTAVGTAVGGINNRIRTLSLQEQNISMSDFGVDDNEASMTSQPGHSMTSQQGEEMSSQQSESMTSQPDHSMTSQPGHSMTSQQDHSMTSQQGEEMSSQQSESMTSQPDHSMTSQPGHSMTSQQDHSMTSQPGHSMTSQQDHSMTSQQGEEMSSQQSESMTSHPPMMTSQPPMMTSQPPMMTSQQDFSVTSQETSVKEPLGTSSGEISEETEVKLPSSGESGEIIEDKVGRSRGSLEREEVVKTIKEEVREAINEELMAFKHEIQTNIIKQLAERECSDQVGRTPTDIKREIRELKKEMKETKKLKKERKMMTIAPSLTSQMKPTREFAASFICENLADGSCVAVGQNFAKYWVLRNEGRRPWDRQVKLELLKETPSGGTSVDPGDSPRMWGPESAGVVVPTVAAGNTVVMSVRHVAPGYACSYTTQWRLSSNGKFFGPRIWCNVEVLDTKEIPLMTSQKDEDMTSLSTNFETENEPSYSGSTWHRSGDPVGRSVGRSGFGGGDLSLLSFEMTSIGEPMEHNNEEKEISEAERPPTEIEDKVDDGALDDDSAQNINDSTENVADLAQIVDDSMQKVDDSVQKVDDSTEKVDDSTESDSADFEAEVLERNFSEDDGDFEVIPLPECFDTSRPLVASLNHEEESLNHDEESFNHDEDFTQNDDEAESIDDAAQKGGDAAQKNDDVAQKNDDAAQKSDDIAETSNAGEKYAPKTIPVPRSILAINDPFTTPDFTQGWEIPPQKVAPPPQPLPRGVRDADKPWRGFEPRTARAWDSRSLGSIANPSLIDRPPTTTSDPVAGQPLSLSSEEGEYPATPQDGEFILAGSSPQNLPLDDVESDGSHNSYSEPHYSHNPSSDPQYSHNPSSEPQYSHNPSPASRYVHRPAAPLSQFVHDSPPVSQISQDTPSVPQISHNPPSVPQISHNPSPMDQLVDMGFMDIDLNLDLLGEFDYDLAKVVNALVYRDNGQGVSRGRRSRVRRSYPGGYYQA